MPDTLHESEKAVHGSSASCLHCGTPLRKNQDQFCCSGCNAVYHTIRNLGLDQFYTYKPIDSPQSPAKPMKDYSYLQNPDLLESIQKQITPEISAVRFYLPTIHCAACVWILERLPLTVRGIRHCRVSFTTGQIEVRYEPKTLGVDQIGSLLHSIGYPPVPAIPNQIALQDAAENRALLIRIGIAAVCAANTMMLADSLFQSFFTGMESHFVSLFTWTSAIISLPAVTWCALPFYRSALGSFMTGRAHIDLPIAIAIIASYGSDLNSTLQGSAHVYFDSITSLIFLLLVARYIQKRALSQTRATTSTTWDLLPQKVHILRDDTIVDDSILKLSAGDGVVIYAGERIPADGIVLSGESEVDTSFLTGESRPQNISKGDGLLAGTLNVSGTITMEVHTVHEGTRLGKIFTALSDSQSRSTTVEDLANEISGKFVVTVLLLSAFTFVGWLFVDPSQALLHTIALLVITCPCALGLAVPVTVAVALAQARRNDFFIHNPDALSSLHRGEHFYFDKTGTLTYGTLSVVDEVHTFDSQRIAWTLITHASTHPVSKALKEHLSKTTFNVDTLIKHEYVPSRGILGLTTQGQISLGSLKWAFERSVMIPQNIQTKIESWNASHYTITLVEHLGECIGAFALQDIVTPDACTLIQSLQNQGKEVFILSGDSNSVVQAVAHQLNIPPTNAFGELLPEDKLSILKNDSMKTVMIGDGLNDALAMKEADVSVGLTGGIEATIEQVDIFIPNKGLCGFAQALTASQIMHKTIRWNIIVSLAYNVIGAGLAIFGHVSPLIAAIAMPISSLNVVLHAAMRRYFISKST